MASLDKLLGVDLSIDVCWAFNWGGGSERVRFKLTFDTPWNQDDVSPLTLESTLQASRCGRMATLEMAPLGAENRHSYRLYQQRRLNPFNHHQDRKEIHFNIEISDFLLASIINAIVSRCVRDAAPELRSLFHLDLIHFFFSLLLSFSWWIKWNLIFQFFHIFFQIFLMGVSRHLPAGGRPLSPSFHRGAANNLTARNYTGLKWIFHLCVCLSVCLSVCVQCVVNQIKNNNNKSSWGWKIPPRPLPTTEGGGRMCYHSNWNESTGW